MGAEDRAHRDGRQARDRERWEILGGGPTAQDAWAQVLHNLAERRIAVRTVAGRPAPGRILGLGDEDIVADLLCGPAPAAGWIQFRVRAEKLAQATRLTAGVVREWHPELGWGVLDAAETPGGCWAHFSHLGLRGYGYLEPGRAVDFAWEPADQDGYAYRALVVAYADGRG